MECGLAGCHTILNTHNKTGFCQLHQKRICKRCDKTHRTTKSLCPRCRKNDDDSRLERARATP